MSFHASELPGMPQTPTTPRPTAAPAAAQAPNALARRTQPSAAAHSRASSSVNLSSGPAGPEAAPGTRQSRSASSRMPPAPTSLAPGAAIAIRVVLSGSHLVTIAEGTIIQPYARIFSAAGEVTIGPGCLIEERAVVGFQTSAAGQRARQQIESFPHPNGTPAQGSISLAISLGPGVVINPGATVEASKVGEMTVIEGGAVVGPGCVIGKFCKVGHSLSIPANSVIPDFTVLYGPGIPQSLPLSALHEGTLIGSLLSTNPTIGPVPRSASSSISSAVGPNASRPTSTHRPVDSVDRLPLRDMSIGTPPPEQDPSGSRNSVNLEPAALRRPDSFHGAQHGTPLAAPISFHPRTQDQRTDGSRQLRLVPTPRRRIDVSARDNPMVRQQRRLMHQHHLVVLRKLMAEQSLQSSQPSQSQPSQPQPTAQAST